MGRMVAIWEQSDELMKMKTVVAACCIKHTFEGVVDFIVFCVLLHSGSFSRLRALDM